MMILKIGNASVAAAAISLCATGLGLAGTADTMAKECPAQLNMPPAACVCIGSRAEIELAPRRQALVIAMITRDQATSDRLRGELTVAQVTQAASWTTKTPARRAAQ